MSAPTLLVISQRPEDQAFAAEVALSCGFSLQTVADPREGAGLIAQEKVSVIFADTSTQAQYQLLEDAVQESVGLFSDKINANAIHFLSSEDLENVPQALVAALSMAWYVHSSAARLRAHLSI